MTSWLCQDMGDLCLVPLTSSVVPPSSGVFFPGIDQIGRDGMWGEQPWLSGENLGVFKKPPNHWKRKWSRWKLLMGPWDDYPKENSVIFLIYFNFHFAYVLPGGCVATVCITQAHNNHNNWNNWNKVSWSEDMQSIDKNLGSTSAHVASLFLELMWHHFF